MGQTPFELIPLYPVGNPAHWHDFFASWPLLYVSHLMSLVFDGAFDRHPDLRIVFIEGGFTWAMPVMSRMDRIWEARRGDLPHVRRPRRSMCENTFGSPPSRWKILTRCSSGSTWN